jgi:hypothetical protein
MNDIRIRSIKHQVEEKSEVLNKIVDQIVGKYSKQLTEEVEKVKEQLDKRQALEDWEIENLVMRIPVYMYYAVEGVETLGIESDMAKAVKLEVYNMKYAQAEGTISDKTAEAQNAVIEESLIEVAFSRAYKKLKTQIEIAEHVFSGAKKVLSKRMQDTEISRRDLNG